MYKKSKPGSVVECPALFTLPVVKTWPNTAKMDTRVLRVAEKSGNTSEKTNIRNYIFETLAKPNQKKIFQPLQNMLPWGNNVNALSSLRGTRCKSGLYRFKQVIMLARWYNVLYCVPSHFLDQILLRQFN